MSNEEFDNAESGSEGEGKNPYEHFLNNPAYFSSAMKRLVMKNMLKNMPEPVQKRVKALKNLQIDFLKTECKFFEDVYQLERKYQETYQTYFDKRKTIVAGEYEPNESEVLFKSDDEEEEDEGLVERMKAFKALPTVDPDAKGIPGFWYTIFKNTTLLSDMMQPHDEPILKQLLDIKIKYDEDLSYTVEFQFAPNDFFTDSVLTKKYYLRFKLDNEEPFAFEGPEIYKCIGCNINWKAGQNVTVKTIKKKQKHKARGAVRTISKQVPNDSFFNFFNPPEVPEDESKWDEESQNILATDFEIGHFLRARIIPRAVLYYTGDIIDDESDDDMEEEEEEEEEAEEEEDDEEELPQSKGNKKGKIAKKTGDGQGQQNPAECKQQ